MKQYLLSIYQPDVDPPPPDELEEVMRNVRAVRNEMRAAGAWVFSGGLHAPSTATVINPREETIPMTDGPYVEGKEHIGGLTIIKTSGPRRRARVGAKARPGNDPADRGAAISGRARGVTAGAGRHAFGDRGVFREQYGRAVAVLVRVFGDIDIAEEAVQDAFATAVAALARAGCLRRRPAGSSPPLAIARSIGCDAKHRATTATPRRRCCTRATSRPRRAPCRTIVCG